MKKLLLVLGATIVISFYPILVNAQNVIINEFSNGDTGTDHDWYELIVTEDFTNIQGISIKSTSAPGATDYTGIQLSTTNTEFASLSRGDIIVIYKIGNSSTGDSKIKSLFPSDITSFGSGKVIVVGYDTSAAATNDAAIFENGTGVTKDPWPTLTSGGVNIGLFRAAGIFGISYGFANDDATSFSLGHVLIGTVNAGQSAHFTGDNVSTLPTDPGNWAVSVPDASSSPGDNNGGANGNLPVELTSFSGSVVNNSVQLTWKTATEVNNYGFDIERSSGNEGWQKIGFVAGAGNSNTPKNYSFTDTPSEGTSYSYRLKQIDVDGNSKYYDAVTVNLTAPSEAQLLQNNPNPFNPSTTIKFYTPNTSDVTIRIYDMLGREVTTLINQKTTAGYHVVYWNGKDSRGENVASGVYLYRLTAGSFSETKKMNLLK